MLSVLLNGRAVGDAELKSGVLRAQCPIDGRYIYRLELVGERVLTLGVMVPKNGFFTLTKSGIAQNGWQYCEIKRCLPDESAAAPLPFALSHGEDALECDFCADELLRACLQSTPQLKTALYRGERFLYFPIDLASPCPMAPFFFCLRCFEVSGHTYAALKLKDDIPRPL